MNDEEMKNIRVVNMEWKNETVAKIDDNLYSFRDKEVLALYPELEKRVNLSKEIKLRKERTETFDKEKNSSIEM